MSGEIWILGGTGRAGRDIAARVVAEGLPVTLVGRDARRLRSAAAGIDGEVGTLVAPDLQAMADAVRDRRPAVVVNTVGPFVRSAGQLALACLPHSSYLDLANDFVAANAVLELDGQASAAGRTLVTGAGFGVLATEAVIAAICRDRPTPSRVQVESIPSLATEAGRLGEALARTILEAVPFGGWRYRDGRMVPAPVGGGAHRVVLPDGVVVTAAAWPSGDLIAAHRVSGAADVVAASSEVPSGVLIRLAFPALRRLLVLTPVREFAVRRLAAVGFTAQARPRPHSWGHAIARWPDGTRREGWLRLGDASDCTARVAAAVATAIARGETRPGATTPHAALGDGLIAAAGGELLLDGSWAA